MEMTEIKKPVKTPQKKSNASLIRVHGDTKKRILTELSKINKKSHGKRVKLDELILKLLPKLTAKDVAELQEASLTGRDRLEQNYRTYCTKFGNITMDQFLELISRETLPKILFENGTKSGPQNHHISEEKNGI